MPPSRFHTRWLVAVLSGTCAMGLVFMLLPAITEQFFDALIFSGGRSKASFSPEARSYIRFVYGVLGAVIAAWALLMLLVVSGPFRRGERYAWNWLALSFGGWFVVDTSFSLLSGFWENALFNCGFLLLFAPPLIATRRNFL